MELNPQHVEFRVSSTTIIKIITVIFLFFVLFYLRDLLLAVLGAVVLASAIEPITQWFIERRVPRVPAVLLIYVVLALVVVGVFYLLLIPLLQESLSFLSSLPGYLGAANIDVAGSSAGKLITSSGVFSDLSNQFSIGALVRDINNILSHVSAGFWSSISFVSGGLLSFIIIVVLSFYLAVQEDGIGSFLRTVSPLKHRKYVNHLWTRSKHKIGLWMQGQLLLVVIIAVLVYLALTLLQIKHALLLAVLAGVFELIPLFGPILAAVPAVAIAFLGGGFPTALLVVGAYLIIQQFENQLIYPLVVKKVVGVPPIISIVAIVAGVQLAGFMGLLLSVPVAAILMEFFYDLERDHIREEEELAKR